MRSSGGVELERRTPWSDTADERRGRPGARRHRTSYIASRSRIVSPKRAERLVVIEVADVLAHERLAVHDQRNGILEIGAQREHGRAGGQRGHRAGRIAAAAAKDHRAQRAAPRDRVVHPPRDRALADEEAHRRCRPAARARRRPRTRSARSSGWRSSGRGASGAPAAKSRWCSGVYGSITPSSSLSGATPGSATRARASTIGRRGDDQQRSAASSDSSTTSARVREAPRHQGERLLLAELPLPKRGDGAPRSGRRRPGDSRRGP